MSRKFPSEWFDYEPIKEGIHEARIVPFKCPLPSYYFNQDNCRFQWTPRDVLSRIPNLGLVIDLTQKRPGYYDPEEFRSCGVAYKKIFCPGQAIPTNSVYEEFRDTIGLFFTQNLHNSQVIGVHCTHGVNRTGYLICKFLVDKLRYRPEVALNIFGSRRGYRIGRPNYEDDIRQLRFNR